MPYITNARTIKIVKQLPQNTNLFIKTVRPAEISTFIRLHKGMSKQNKFIIKKHISNNYANDKSVKFYLTRYTDLQMLETAAIVQKTQASIDNENINK